MDVNNTTNIYILRLESGKYYVGKSSNVEQRYQNHLEGKGSSWTKKYKPVAIEKIIEKVSPFDEDKVTKEYMAKYGIDNVRGGTYVETKLSDFQIESLKMEIWSAHDACTRCGRKSHFVKDCYAQTDVDGNEIDSSDDNDEESLTQLFTSIWGSIFGGAKDVCARCGREGHGQSKCYARKHVDGYKL